MWIVLEGIDGAGTTTQTDELVTFFQQQGLPVVSTAEPSNGRIGQLIREALRGEFTRHGEAPLSPQTLALLFAADRMHHVHNEVLPQLEAGTSVVCDRYVHSSLAYQGSELPVDWVAGINRQAPSPDLVIFLDVPVGVALERIKARGQDNEHYETRERLQGIRERYMRVLQDTECPQVTLDGSRDKATVSSDIQSIIRDLIDIHSVDEK